MIIIDNYFWFYTCNFVSWTNIRVTFNQPHFQFFFFCFLHYFIHYPSFCRMKEERILISRDGPYENVLKFKPPMCFSLENVDTLVEMLDSVFAELTRNRESAAHEVKNSNNSAVNDELSANGEPPVKRPCLNGIETKTRWSLSQSGTPLLH